MNLEYFTEYAHLDSAAASLQESGWGTADREELHRRTIEDATEKAEAAGYDLTDEDWEAIEQGFETMMERIAYYEKPVKVINAAGAEIDYETAVALMDDELREELHSKGYDTEQEFFSAYESAHAAKYGEEWELSKSNPAY